MAISDRGTPVGKQYEFRAPPSAARRIADAGVDDAEAYRYRLVNAGGPATVAFVGVSHILPWGFTAAPDHPGVTSRLDLPRVYETVRAAKPTGIHAGESPVTPASCSSTSTPTGSSAGAAERSAGGCHMEAR